MFVRQSLIIAFTILICSRVSIDASDTGCSNSNAEEQKVQDLLLKILTAGHEIEAYEEECYNRAYKKIVDSNQSNKDEQLKRLKDLYDKHIKNYPKQGRQASQDGQMPEPISRNPGIALCNQIVNALCHQMFDFIL